MKPRWLVVVALTLYACNSTGVGNPAPVKLQLAIIRDDEAVAPLGGAPGTAGTAGAPTNEGGELGVGGALEAAALPGAAIHDAVLVIGEVRFLPCDADDAGSIAKGPFLVDLLRGGTLPKIPEVPVPAGGFCGLDAPLAPARSPSRLVGRSVYFGGERADGTPFRFYANVQATLRVRARAGVTWTGVEGPTRSVFWALRPRQWLEPGELNALEASLLGDGTNTETIDVEGHPALLRAIRSRLAGRSTLYADVNDDSAFDLADRDVVLGDGVPDAD